MSFLQVSHEFVEAVRNRLGVPPDRVHFVGSSSGGHAALALCDLMRGSNAVCDNPQFYLRHSASHRPLEAATGVSIGGPDRFGRADIGRFVTNTDSSFYVEINANSPHDHDLQLRSLVEDQGLDLSVGVNFVHRSLLVLHPYTYAKPHHTFSDAAELRDLTALLEGPRTDRDAVRASVEAHLRRKQTRLSVLDLAARVTSELRSRRPDDAPAVARHKEDQLRVAYRGRAEYFYAVDPALGTGTVSLYAFKRACDPGTAAAVSSPLISDAGQTPNTYRFTSVPFPLSEPAGTIVDFIDATLGQVT